MTDWTQSNEVEDRSVEAVQKAVWRRTEMNTMRGVGVGLEFQHSEQVPKVLGLSLALGLDDQSLRPLAPQFYTLQSPLKPW